MDGTEKLINETEERIRTYQRAYDNLDVFPAAFRTDRGRQALSELQRADLPYATELRTLLTQYDDITTRYTSKYPEVVKTESQILELLKRVRVAVQSELGSLASRMLDLQRTRTQIIDEIMHSSVAQRLDQDKESNYALYRQLYNDMKVKLEQARTAKELGKKAEDAFIIIDPARVPAKPTKPNRLLIILGGLGLGTLLGVLSAGLAELLDTTVRTPSAIEIYQKPIIALLPDGRET
jgi:uncharacterized protein involved in exopolysaccharide biosynthesis